jgi:cytochrome c-type biogenesis protein CcmH/NrfG
MMKLRVGQVHQALRGSVEFSIITGGIMKKIASILTVLVLLFVFLGCQKKEEKSQMTYTPPPGPSPLEISQLQQAAKRSPKNKDVWINLGNALMDSQRFNEAIEAYQKALVLDPKNVSVRVDMGTCYRGIGKSDKAVEEYRKALKIDPNFPNGHRNLAVVLSSDLHQNKEAIKEFQKYLELMPNAPDADVIRRTIQQLSSVK